MLTAGGGPVWSETDAAAAGAATEQPAPSLSEAYSNMHKLDALLKDSDRQLKVASCVKPCT